MLGVPRTPTRTILLALASLTIVFSAVMPASAADAYGPEEAPLRELPDLVLRPWLKSQTQAGNFRRPSGTPAFDGYANAGISYGMIQESVRTGDLKYFKSAMRSFRWMTRSQVPTDSIFYRMFSASAYNLTRANFATRPEFQRIRSAWSNQLRRFPYQRGILGTRYHYNKNLVEALEVIELYNSGLRGNAPKAVLRDRGEALRRALRLLNVWIPRRVTEYTQSLGAEQGWPFATTGASMSDPPANPPAYNALTAGLYARAYSRLPERFRTARMHDTSEVMIRGVIARTAPDGDIAFDGRSQEQAWALSSAAYGAWSAAKFETGPMRETFLAFARRVVKRLETAHVTSASSFGFVLTPAAGCCDRSDTPPGQDLYYDVAKYSGLTALTLGWAIAERPDDWQSGSDRLPTDSPSDYVSGAGRGRFYQHRGADIYCSLRQQSQYLDARSDMGLSVLKVKNSDGSWSDAVPPRPYTGGHHRPADPAAPCLVYLKGCAYLELHGGQRSGTGYQFSAIWRTPRNTVVRRGSALATPTANGLTLSWSSQAGDDFRVVTFLPTPTCSPSGAAAPGVSIVLSGQTRCRIAKTVFAGGSRVDLRRVEQAAPARNGSVEVTYAAAGK